MLVRIDVLFGVSANARLYVGSHVGGAGKAVSCRYVVALLVQCWAVEIGELTRGKLRLMC